MPRQYFKQPRSGKRAYRTRPKKMVPGYGGMVGRGVGWFRKNMTSKGSTMNWLLKKTKQLADAVNIEYKASTYQTTGAIDYNGNVQSLISIAQGVTDSERIGDSLKLQNLNMRYYVSRTTGDALVRVMIIFDPQNKISAVSDVLSTSGNAYGVVSPKNYDKRFYGNVLYDKLNTVTSGNATIQNEDITIPIDKHVQFSSGTTTVNSGDLKILIVSNLVTSNLPTIQLFARLTYTDD